MQDFDLPRPRSYAQRRFAVGGYQSRRHGAPPGPAQRLDDIETVGPLAEMQVGQHEIGQSSRPRHFVERLRM